MAILSLYQLQLQIKEVISEVFSDVVWVMAEIGSLSVNAISGHCYMELLDKDAGSQKEARVRANLWKNNYRSVNQRFEIVTGSALQKGLRVLLLVKVEYHEQYGMALVVEDIEPSFTLGELSRRKAEVLKRLESENLLEVNAALELPIVLQKIAIISSQGAAGFEDFMRHLHHNEFGFAFSTTLFPALMQGEEAEQSMLEALKQIELLKTDFDAVAIIRGGGSPADLACFNGYELGKAIALFPIPVFTGIGHERDESVADVAAHTRFKTPTAVAAFFVQMALNMDAQLTEYGNILMDLTRKKLDLEQRNLLQFAQLLQSFSSFIFTQQKMQVVEFQTTLKALARIELKREEQKLQMLEKTIALLDPNVQLKRGFTLTMQKGKILKSVAEVNAEEMLETIFKDGKIESKPTP